MAAPASNPPVTDTTLLRLLIIEHNAADVELSVRQLEQDGFRLCVDVAATPEELRQRLAESDYDLVLSDYRLPGWTGIDGLHLLRQQGSHIPFILVTGTLGEEAAVEGIKQGVTDYVLKDHPAKLPTSVRRALEERKVLEERQQTLQALRMSEEHYRHLVEASPDAIFIACEGRVTFINPAGVKLFGAEEEGQLVGQRVLDLIHRDFRDLVQERVRESELSGKPAPLQEERFLRLDGAGVDVEVTATPFSWEGRVAAQVVARDISERKRAEKALRRSEAALRSLVENAPYAIYRTHVERGRFVSANPALVKMLGYGSEAELCDMDLATQVYRDPQARARVLLQLEREGRWQDLELEWTRKDGSPLLLRTSGRMIREADGEEYSEAMAEDITEKRSLERQLQHAQRLEAVGRLAGGVAHDFNNLLTVIRGYAELMLQVADWEKVREHAGKIIKATDRTAALTRQLLAFSRKQVLWPQVLDLNAVLSETQKMLRPLLGEDVQVIVTPSPRLGRVKADPGQLEQVLMNLAINARDAMPKGGKLILETANVECDESYCAMHPGARPGAYVMVAVSDNGCGMDSETQLHIFEPFFTTKPKDKGTGLGLATVYGIVKQSGGHIWVYSEPGIGTTFKIYLPRVEGRTEAPAPYRRFEEPAAVSETVLLVEDEEGVRQLARGFLEQRGYRVLEARNGAEALKTAAAHAGPIHLLITDMVMPGMRGDELAKRLSAVRPCMKVLCISGYTDSSIRENGALGFCSAFLEKPFSSDALARRVRQVLSDANPGAGPTGTLQPAQEREPGSSVNPEGKREP